MSTTTITPSTVEPYGLRDRLAFDLETFLIGPGAVLPKPVCASLARRAAPGVLSEPPQVHLVASGDVVWEATLEGALDEALERGVELVGHNVAAFDLPVIAVHFPRLLSKCFSVVERGLVRDTMLREQLLTLATKGHVDEFYLPDGTRKKVRYRLSDLVAKHLGRDRSSEKSNSGERPGDDDEEARQDVWQLHFDVLDGVPVDRYPVEASAYVLQDAVDPLLVAEAQDALARREFAGRIKDPNDLPFDAFGTEWLHVRAGFALALFSSVPFGVDRVEVQRMRESLDRALRPENVAPLYAAGILDPPIPARPWANGALNVDGMPKVVPAQRAKKRPKRLLEVVLQTWQENHRCDEPACPRSGGECEDHGLLPLRRTEPSKTHGDGQISCDADTIDSLAPFNPTLALFSLWQSLGKVRDLELPLLEGTDVIHGAYECIKKTGRTSCRGSRNFPSRNLQQIPRSLEVEELDGAGQKLLDEEGKPRRIRIEPRRCYRAPWEGWLLLSVDFSYLELCTLAQTVFCEIGSSKLRDVINAGKDPHAWLAAQLAAGCDRDFADYCVAVGAQDSDGRHAAFEAIKHGSDDEQNFFRKFRQVAKSCGLAFGGGMGAKRLLDYARQQYAINIESLDEAKRYRQCWMDAFPENREYLRRFDRGPRGGIDEEHSDEERERYYYFSPLGMLRRRCSYTEAMNGFALQTPAAEGAKLALFDVARACWDPEARNATLLGCRPIAYVHDELIVAVPEDAWLHERGLEVSRLMCAAMSRICPDVTIRAEPAAMRNWFKGAEAVYGSDDRLRVWEPEVKYRVDAGGKLRVPQ